MATGAKVRCIAVRQRSFFNTKSQNSACVSKGSSV